MISAKKARIKAIQNKLRLSGVDLTAVQPFKRLVSISVNKAVKDGKFQTTISLPTDLNEATFEYLKSILMSKCFFCSISHKGTASILLVEWE